MVLKQKRHSNEKNKWQPTGSVAVKTHDGREYWNCQVGARLEAPPDIKWVQTRMMQQAKPENSNGGMDRTHAEFSPEKNPQGNKNKIQYELLECSARDEEVKVEDGFHGSVLLRTQSQLWVMTNTTEGKCVDCGFLNSETSYFYETSMGFLVLK